MQRDMQSVRLVRVKRITNAWWCSKTHALHLHGLAGHTCMRSKRAVCPTFQRPASAMPTCPYALIPNADAHGLTPPCCCHAIHSAPRDARRGSPEMHEHQRGRTTVVPRLPGLPCMPRAHALTPLRPPLGLLLVQWPQHVALVVDNLRQKVAPLDDDFLEQTSEWQCE